MPVVALAAPDRCVIHSYTNYGKKFNLRIWNDPKEKKLLLLACIFFVILCIVEVRLPLIPALHGTTIGILLKADATQSITSDLIVGILSAYFFYLFIDFLPRVRRESKTTEVLNSLIASVLDAYKRCRIFGHETALSHVDKSVLSKVWLDEQVAILKENKSDFLSLKFSMQTAYTRIEDFRHALPLAVNLSPEHAMRWLIMVDKIRLLSENYGKQPPIPEKGKGVIMLPV